MHPRRCVMTPAETDHMEKVHARLDALAGLFERLALTPEASDEDYNTNTWWMAHHALQREVDAIEELMAGRIKDEEDAAAAD